VVPEQAFLVVITFDSGAGASISMDDERVLSTSMWAPATLSCIGDAGGPRIDFVGRELAELSIIPSSPVSSPAEPPAHFGTA